MERGEIYWTNLGEGIGSEQCGYRPVLIVQNNIGNEHSPTVIVVPISTNVKRKMPTHHIIKYPLKKRSCIFCEQIRTIDKSRCLFRIGSLDEDRMRLIDRKIKISLGLE